MSTMLAIKTGMVELEVGEDEMTAWLKAASKVSSHYSIETTQKALDWTAFAGVTVQVFGTRAVAIAVRSKREQGPARRGPATVHEFRAPAMAEGPAEAPEGFAG